MCQMAISMLLKWIDLFSGVLPLKKKKREEVEQNDFFDKK